MNEKKQIFQKKLFSFLSRDKSAQEIQTIINAIKKEPDNERFYIRLADLYMRSGKEENAVNAYEKAAFLFEKKGFSNKAKALLKQALSINPEHAGINIAAGDLDYRNGQERDALAHYQAALNYYDKSGNTLEAADALQRITRLNPEDLTNILMSRKVKGDALPGNYKQMNLPPDLSDEERLFFQQLEMITQQKRNKKS